MRSGMHLDVEIVGIVAQALFEAGLDAAPFPSAFENKLLSAFPTANGHFHFFAHAKTPLLIRPVVHIRTSSSANVG